MVDSCIVSGYRVTKIAFRRDLVITGQKGGQLIMLEDDFPAQYIDELQSIPWDSKDNETAAMFVPCIVEVNEILLKVPAT